MLKGHPARLPPEINQISGKIITASYEVHSIMGPGLLESVYEDCLANELSRRGIPFERQKEIPIQYKDTRLGSSLRIDLLVGDKVVVELKAADGLLPIHEAQLLTYLRLTGCRLGLLLNFNVKFFKEGIRRLAL